MFIVALAAIARLYCKAKRNPSFHLQMSRQMKCDTMQYYSALRRNEILTHATTWMKFEDIILSEIS